MNNPCPVCGSTKISVVRAGTCRWAAARCDECGSQAYPVRTASVMPPISAEDEAAALSVWDERWAQPATRAKLVNAWDGRA